MEAALMEAIQLSTILPTSPEALYTAWLDSREHTAFTAGDNV